MNVILLLVFLGLLCWAKAELCYEIREDYALYGHNDKTYPRVSLEECQDLCTKETAFKCLSFDHSSSRTCWLSHESHETDPAMYGPHGNAVYGFLIPCDDENELPGEGSGSGSGSGSESGSGDDYYPNSINPIPHTKRSNSIAYVRFLRTNTVDREKPKYEDVHVVKSLRELLIQKQDEYKHKKYFGQN